MRTKQHTVTIGALLIDYSFCPACISNYGSQAYMYACSVARKFDSCSRTRPSPELRHTPSISCACGGASSSCACDGVCSSCACGDISSSCAFRDASSSCILLASSSNSGFPWREGRPSSWKVDGALLSSAVTVPSLLFLNLRMLRVPNMINATEHMGSTTLREILSLVPKPEGASLIAGADDVVG